MSSLSGAVVVHGSTAYFTQGPRLYSYTLPEDKWTQLQQCEYEDSSLAVVNDILTTVGGSTKHVAATNSLLSLTRGRTKKWRKLHPPMPTPRIYPATLSTSTHLVVAGGRRGKFGDGLSSVEVMSSDTYQWFVACSLPQEIKYPLMALCGGYLYVSNSLNNAIFSYSMEELIQSCQVPYTNTSSSRDECTWTRLPAINDICNGPTLATVGEHLLAIGGIVNSDQPTGVVHCYDRTTDLWSVTGKMPTSRYCALVTVLPSDEVVVVGGKKNSFSLYDVTEIGKITLY